MVSIFETVPCWELAIQITERAFSSPPIPSQLGPVVEPVVVSPVVVVVESVSVALRPEVLVVVSAVVPVVIAPVVVPESLSEVLVVAVVPVLVLPSESVPESLSVALVPVLGEVVLALLVLAGEVSLVFAVSLSLPEA